ncbi:MAG TPA: Fur family transcriptional regulator [Vicinamibacterales bacterium]|nr:Fur family transcriptional regulator [Vicinamibacterales bacterium]
MPEDRSRAAAILRRHGLRVTPQRRAVWTAVMSAGGHVSADDVLRRARRRLPELSRATVYNALNEFVAAGLLAIVTGDGVQLYDPNLAPHHHFRCRACRRLFDVQPPGVARLGRALGRGGFTVEQTQVVFEGLCGDCRGRSPAPGRR